MKPRARRFRLRLSEDATGSPLPSVAPQTQGRGPAEPAPQRTPERVPERGRASERPHAEALFDEAGDAARAGNDAGGRSDAGDAPDGNRPPEAAAGANAGVAAVTRSAAAVMAMAKLRQSADALAHRSRATRPDQPEAEQRETGRQETGRQETDRQETDRHEGAPQGAAPSAATTPGQPATGGAQETAQHSVDVTGSPEVDAEIEAIRAEELTGRQLRMAMRVALKHGIKATSGLEAVRLLRRQGIDPFEHSTLLDIVKDKEVPGRALTTTQTPPLPKTFRQPGGPVTPHAPPDPATRNAEIARIQNEISRRRRRRLALLGARLSVFVLLPTFLAAWYFYMIATPLYATNTEFVIQQADSQPSAGAGGALGGLFSGTGLATSQDSVTVQSYLQSREAMRRLDADHGFKAHFQDERVDPLRRLALGSTDEAAYRLYRRHVQISYDPTEGIIKMEVIAADPETSERFSRALIQYAEDQVDQLTQRLRENQMRDAMESFERAEAQMLETQMRVLELQESYQVLSSEVEVTLLTQQITTLEGQINQERLSLADLLANPRPNAARVQQVERRIGALDTQIQALRSSLTRGEAGGASLARVQREMVMAEADVATRQLMLATSLQQLEAARIEANRQVRYLSMGVSPIAPDESTYPRRLENTALAFLIFAGAYLMISMTVSILREQVTS